MTIPREKDNANRKSPRSASPKNPGEDMKIPLLHFPTKPGCRNQEDKRPKLADLRESGS
jgi:replicative DNA helicase